MKIPNTQALVKAARRAVRKMEHEYRCLEPTSDPDECWQECQALKDAVADFDHIFPPE